MTGLLREESPQRMNLSDKYSEALAFAFDLHRGQQRQGSGVPYVAHLLGVSSLVLEYGGDENQAIAGLLHDAVEDQGGSETLAAVRERFGEDVAAIVAACSDSIDPPRPPWRRRKELYLDHLGKSPGRSQLVAACDKLYNARAILSDLRQVGDRLWDRFSGGKQGVLWYYGALAATFTIESPVVGELGRVVQDIVSNTGLPIE